MYHLWLNLYPILLAGVMVGFLAYLIPECLGTWIEKALHPNFTSSIQMKFLQRFSFFIFLVTAPACVRELLLFAHGFIDFSRGTSLLAYPAMLSGYGLVLLIKHFGPKLGQALWKLDKKLQGSTK